MSSPFPAIIHNWDKLNDRVKEAPDSQVCKDLANLLNRVKNAPELEAYFKLRGSNENTRTVTFETLWAAFAPGQLIVARPFMDTAQIMMVEDSPLPWNNNPNHPLSMWAWTWDWDGRRLLKVEHAFKIDRFRGTKDVTSLEYVPLEMYEDAEELKKVVRERSRKLYVCSLASVSESPVLFFDKYSITFPFDLLPFVLQSAKTTLESLFAHSSMSNHYMAFLCKKCPF